MIGDQDQEVGSGGILKHTILPVVAEIGEMPTGEENIGETEGESGQRGSDSREMSIGNYSFNFTFTVLRKKKIELFFRLLVLQLPNTFSFTAFM